jgi:hypothetical protein
LKENIGNYLKACQALGMKSTDLFQTVDLYEAKNMTQALMLFSSLLAFFFVCVNHSATGVQFYDDARTQVVQNIHALGRVAQKMPGYTGPVIGVRESDKHVSRGPADHRIRYPQSRTTKSCWSKYGIRIGTMTTIRAAEES